MDLYRTLEFKIQMSLRVYTLLCFEFVRVYITKHETNIPGRLGCENHPPLCLDFFCYGLDSLSFFCRIFQKIYDYCLEISHPKFPRCTTGFTEDNSIFFDFHEISLKKNFAKFYPSDQLIVYKLCDYWLFLRKYGVVNKHEIITNIHF